MQARRKPADPALTAPTDVPVEPGMPVRLGGAQLVPDGDLPVSPALLLREQLAARLAEVEIGALEIRDASKAPEVKLPVALRIATITTLSAGLWGGIYLSASKLITG